MKDAKMTDSDGRRYDDLEIHELRKEVAELKAAVANLVDAWNAAKGFLAFIKWSAALGSALAVIYSTFHNGLPK